MTDFATSGNREIVISFDDTGSMHTIRARVRRHVNDLTRRLFSTDPSIRLGIVAHGDYCDDLDSNRRAHGFYLMKSCPLTNDPVVISRFINEVGPTGGCGPYAAYEYVLNKMRTFNWTAGISKAIVLIGDEPPHDTSWPEMRSLVGHTIDWRNEATILRDAGIKVFAVQALRKGYATPFYRDLAQMTNGFYLELDQFDSIVEIIEAIAMKQVSDDHLISFEERLLQQGRMNRNLDSVIGTLSGRTPAVQSKFVQKWGAGASLDAVVPGRFQSMLVYNDTVIKGFVEENALKFEKGKGFYELTKSETIQPYKEIVLEDKNTGDMFTGRKARDLIGLAQDQEVSFTSTRKSWSNQYRVFVQSTSYNRKLVAGTRFLYEVDQNA